ncbi:OLC1v1020917C1 [Oldenlandia corymbosa var. corymbosa]|uniref:OLC1v1020917C1 n=1 Tax=Oldenlandia corymbosa var. corymbosa TaxID=529605 RepID=A0AAV1BY87_OLDCO|nr:OLC1v1020917C1 [Oldenlandia corymbosa var. corymbosa]
MLSSSFFSTATLPILQSDGFKPSTTTSPSCSFTSPNAPLNSATYGSLLDSCCSAEPGKQIHAHSLKNGFVLGGTPDNNFVQTKLVQMYARCGHLDDAVQVFEEMPVRSLYAWIAIMNMFLDNGFFEEAFSCFQDLQLEDIELEFFAFPVALKICSGVNGGAGLGSQLHGTVIKRGFTSNIYVGNALIDMYGKCGRLEDAKAVFDLMLERDCVSWNSIVTACTANGMVNDALEFLRRMSSGEDDVAPTVVSWSAVIGGLAQNGYDEEAIDMLYSMLEAGFKPNAQTLASVLPACARLQRLGLGKEIHGYLFRHLFMHNSFVVNGLVDLYRRCGKMETAQILFLLFSTRNEVSYNTMIVGYFETGEISRAEELFDEMELEGRRDVINSWNSMISGYVNNSMMDKALTLFRDLVSKDVKANSYTLGSVLTAIADTASSRIGKEVHSYAIGRGMQSDTFVGGALVEMYCKCKDLNAAQKAFDEVIEKDTPTWNVLISGYAQLKANQESINCLLQKMKEDGFDPNVYTWNGIIAGHVENDNNEVALQLFLAMQSSSNIRPDIYTIGIILPVCSRLATIDRGMQAHAFAIKRGFESEPHVGVALLDMYAKCGNLKYSKRVYNRIRNSNLVTENAMLSAYATHGEGEEGITFFRRLLVNGFNPDGVTFLSALSCCVHAGSVEEGRECYNMMAYYDVKPTLKHYTCLVDLLSRAGLLQEAYKVISKMPMKPDSVIWGALLGGCVIHGNIEIGELAAENLIELEPNNTANHVMLGNLYASAGRWNDLARTRQQMTELHMRKKPGCSWIEDKDGIHVFLACDMSHSRSKEIYNILDKLTLQISVYPE